MRQLTGKDARTAPEPLAWHQVHPALPSQNHLWGKMPAYHPSSIRHQTSTQVHSWAFA